MTGIAEDDSIPEKLGCREVLGPSLEARLFQGAARLSPPCRPLLDQMAEKWVQSSPSPGPCIRAGGAWAAAEGREGVLATGIEESGQCFPTRSQSCFGSQLSLDSEDPDSPQPLWLRVDVRGREESTVGKGSVGSRLPAPSIHLHLRGLTSDVTSPGQCVCVCLRV